MTTREGKGLALEGVKLTLRHVKEEQAGFVQDAVDTLHAVQTTCEYLQAFERAKEAVRAGEEASRLALATAQQTVDALTSCTEFVAFDLTGQALDYAKHNTSKLNLARHVVELAEDAAKLGLDVGEWISSHGSQLINLTKVEFSGSVSSLASNGPPLVVNIEGTVFGDRVDVHIN